MVVQKGPRNKQRDFDNMPEVKGATPRSFETHPFKKVSNTRGTNTVQKIKTKGRP